jgi:hypothetical protein
MYFLGRKGAHDTSIIRSSRAWCDADCRAQFSIAQIIWRALPNNGISIHSHNPPLVSQQVYWLLSCNPGHHLVLTLGNTGEQKRLVGCRILASIAIEYYLIETRCPWPAIFCHAPPPWITNPTPHAPCHAPCGSNLTGKQRYRTIAHSGCEFCKLFYYLN